LSKEGGKYTGIATSPEEDQGTVTGDPQFRTHNFVKVGPAVPDIMLADRQTG